MSLVQASHKRLLTRFTLLLHGTIAVITLLSAQLPSFDSSASVVLENKSLTSLLRWDSFHFVHIAESGYVFEDEYAFFPGVPRIMGAFEKLSQLAGAFTERFEGALLAGPILSAVISVDAVHTLYDLSLHHLQSPHAALLVSLLSLLSSSPATLRFAPYAEPFFTYLSYKGMLRCAKGRFVQASILFALASTFRSNGTMLAGYIIWDMLVVPVLQGTSIILNIRSRQFLSRVFSCVILSALPIMPFVWHQYEGYVEFCTGSTDQRRPWCTKRLPFIYSFVQSEYWGVGLFRYWTLQQAPNFLLGSPVLILLMYGSISHIRYALLPRITAFLRISTVHDKTTPPAVKDPFLNPSLTPHAIHALILSLILLTSAHTQIALRFASALPFTYWTAAWLFLRERDREKQGHNPRKDTRTETSRAARLWVGWSIVWGLISLVAWGVFLPPA